jgi:hypothetical protein
MATFREFKHEEEVKCEICGEWATEFDHGIAGICQHCGNQWGDWEYYDEDLDEIDYADET